MATECTIQFDNNQFGVYYGGQLLSGSVVLTTKKEKSIRAIHITIEGFASVQWKVTKSRQERNRTVHTTVVYKGHEQYLSSRKYVIGQEGGNSLDLLPGSYTYNFQVALPYQLPSSFEGSYGHVRYQAVVTVDRPWRFDNVFKKPFSVISSLDLNMNAQYKLPMHAEDEKIFCCCCCESGPVTATVDIPFSGYAPGQKLQFVILIDNESTTDCTDIRVKMERDVVFTSQIPERDTRDENQKVAEKTLGPVLKLSKKEFRNFLELPALPPSSLNICSIIDIRYWLHVVIETPGCHSNMELKLPITIGTVPLYESATNPANVITTQPTAPQMSVEGDSPPGYNCNIPPSYEEAMSRSVFIDEDSDKHATVEPYVPKYPVYYNFASAPQEDGAVYSNQSGDGMNSESKS